MVDIWSAESRIILERELWVAVLKAQKELGIEIEDQVIEDYESVIESVDLNSIRKREKITRHDVKARLEEFSELAGHQHAHKGMTSRDLTENVEQLQIKKSIKKRKILPGSCNLIFARVCRGGEGRRKEERTTKKEERRNFGF